jgi:hypothetical protein
MSLILLRLKASSKWSRRWRGLRTIEVEVVEIIGRVDSQAEKGSRIIETHMAFRRRGG